MNRLSIFKRSQIVAALVEGNSLRATSRMTDVSINTVTKLLVDLGAACLAYHDANVRGLKTQRLECDEIWSYCYAKARNVPFEKQGEFGYGDVWTWTALDADSKLIVSYDVGPRTLHMAYNLLEDVNKRVTTRMQMTTDGLRWYRIAAEHVFGIDVDYATLEKHYGNPAGYSGTARYSPPTLSGTRKEVIKGSPDPKYISTSFVERQNLTMRMSMRRFTRLTNAFSKKLENHIAAIALHFMHYNFARIHKTLRVTPAMAAGLAAHPWTIEEIVGLLDAAAKKAA